MILNTKDIESLDKTYRRNLINQLSGVKGANLIATQNNKGKSNLAIFNSVVHLGANPACMGFIMRPLAVARHTYENIKESGFYTINSVNVADYEKAHHTAAKWDKSEFDTCNFEAFYSEKHSAPYVNSSAIKIGLEFLEEHEIQYNKTILIVGKIVEVIIEDDLLDDLGYFDFVKANQLSVAGLDNYFSSKKVAKLDFPRVNELVKHL